MDAKTRGAHTLASALRPALGRGGGESGRLFMQSVLENKRKPHTNNPKKGGGGGGGEEGGRRLRPSQRLLGKN